MPLETSKAPASVEAKPAAAPAGPGQVENPQAKAAGGFFRKLSETVRPSSILDRLARRVPIKTEGIGAASPARKEPSVDTVTQSVRPTIDTSMKFGAADIAGDYNPVMTNDALANLEPRPPTVLPAPEASPTTSQSEAQPTPPASADNATPEGALTDEEKAKLAAWTERNPKVVAERTTLETAAAVSDTSADRPAASDSALNVDPLMVLRDAALKKAAEADPAGAAPQAEQPEAGRRESIFSKAKGRIDALNERIKGKVNGWSEKRKAALEAQSARYQQSADFYKRVRERNNSLRPAQGNELPLVPSTPVTPDQPGDFNARRDADAKAWKGASGTTSRQGEAPPIATDFSTALNEVTALRQAAEAGDPAAKPAAEQAVADRADAAINKLFADGKPNQVDELARRNPDIASALQRRRDQEAVARGETVAGAAPVVAQPEADPAQAAPTASGEVQPAPSGETSAPAVPAGAESSAARPESSETAEQQQNPSLSQVVEGFLNSPAGQSMTPEQQAAGRTFLEGVAEQGGTATTVQDLERQVADETDETKKAKLSWILTIMKALAAAVVIAAATPAVAGVGAGVVAVGGASKIQG